MSEHSLRLGVIIGSVRAGRFGPTVAAWFTGQAAQRGDLEIDLIDLADAPLSNVITTEPPPETVRGLTMLSPRLAAADAFVVVTPEYNHSFPASLKSAIDWHFVQWQAKPIGFVSYGGMAGGLRAVEHLRLVFAELHAVTIRDTISFHRAMEAFESDGEPKNPVECNAAAKIMLDQLVWWAHALREARTARPYQA